MGNRTIFFQWLRYSSGTDGKLFAVLQCSGRTISGERMQIKEICSSHYRIPSRKFSGFWRGFAAGFSKLKFKCRDDLFEESLDFEKNLNFRLLRNQRKLFLPFCKNRSTGRLKLCSMVHSKFLREKIFSRKSSFQVFLDIGRRNFRILSEIFQ